MPKETETKTLCINNLRHAEYYGMQNIFDELFQKSKDNEVFDNLMDIILSRENILLAYRNIKSNTGSKTAGTDKLTIEDIGKLSVEEVVEKVRFIVKGSKHGYRPKPVRRVDIPKLNGDTRPLGIPCIWDRLVQQCIKQVMEPICEAKFSDNSYGFRPNRSVENAIARTYRHMQRSNLHYVVEFDIKGFFDNVNHSKLIKQIWALKIRDKHLIYLLKQILKAPIKLPDGSITHPTKGTPQGGIISPLLANIVLNELDHWVESQWEENPIIYTYKLGINNSGGIRKSNGYEGLKTTNLKEMFIVRYADDFRIFCRARQQAEKVKIAVSKWIQERLKLEVSEEKTRIVNMREKYSEFLGFKMKVRRKGNKYVVISHINDKQLKRIQKSLVEQARKIAKPRKEYGEYGEVKLYNSKVLGIQNYYNLATEVNEDLGNINRIVMTTLTNRLSTQTGKRLVRSGRKLNDTEKKWYGKSKAIRYVNGTNEPIYPIGYVQHKNPLNHRKKICNYSKEGRENIHNNLKINTGLMLQLMKQPVFNQSAEFADNKISLFSEQYGKCAITGIEFTTTNEIHCHHKFPKEFCGNDKYDNLILVLEPVHKLIHAVKEETIEHYLKILNLNKKQLKALNELRKIAGYEIIK